MPTYSYKCANCDHILEVFQTINEDPLITCPECGQDQLGKVLLSAPSFQLKGKGWYKTDYSNKKDNGASSEKPSSGDSKN